MITKMKILVVTQYYYPESVAITPLCEGLVRLGHQVQVLTSKPQYGFGQIPRDYVKITDEIISGVNIHRVKTYARDGKPLSVLRNYVTFYQAAMKDIDTLSSPYDVVLSVSYSPIMAIAPAVYYAKKYHLPHLLYAVDVWPEALLTVPFFRTQGWIYRWLSKWSHHLYRQVDQIVVGSPSYQPHFVKLLGAKSVSQTILYQPALIESLPDQVMDYGDGFHMVYAGNMGHIQGLTTLIQQWQHTQSKFHLHLIGSGRYKQKLVHLIRDLKLESRVHMYAHQTPDNLGKFFANADAFYLGLVTSGIVGKTIPQKLVQSLVVGKPILANLKGDGLTLLKAQPGIFVLDTQAKNLVTLLGKISKLTTKQKEMIRQTQQQYYQQHLSMQVASKTLEDQLMSLINSTKS